MPRISHDRRTYTFEVSRGWRFSNGEPVTPQSILDGLRRLDAGVPLAVMTYYNIAFHAGHERFAASLAEAGITGAILPDLPLEEAGPWCEAADAAGIATVLLAARRSLASVCENCNGTSVSAVPWCSWIGAVMSAR